MIVIWDDGDDDDNDESNNSDKVTFEGAFDVFLELCREYCGQFRSHLSSDLIREATEKKDFLVLTT